MRRVVRERGAERLDLGAAWGWCRARVGRTAFRMATTLVVYLCNKASARSMSHPPHRLGRTPPGAELVCSRGRIGRKIGSESNNSGPRCELMNLSTV